MAANQLNAFLSRARSCALEMLENSSYIKERLPSIDLAESYRTAILDVCSDLVGTKHDIINEVDELYELAAPPTSEVVQYRVERIVGWLGEEMPKLHAVVSSLDLAGDDEPGCGSAYILVAESAANVYRSYAQVTTAADDYRTALLARNGPGDSVPE